MRPRPDNEVVLRIAVVIPCYNYAAFVRNAVESAKAQSSPPDEIIVVNDGSTDDSDKVLRGIKGITYISQDNQGLAAARNRGVRESSCEGFCFLDADDELLPDALSALRACIETHPEHGLYYGQAIVLSRNGKTREHLSGGAWVEGPIPQATLKNLPGSRICSPGAAIIRRSLIETLDGFRSCYNGVEDRDFYIRAGLRSTFKFCDAVVLRKYLHNHNMSANLSVRITKGLRLQLDFLVQERPADRFPAFQHLTPGFFVNQAIFGALSIGDQKAIQAILELCKTRHICTLKSFLLKWTPWIVKSHYRLLASLQRTSNPSALPH